ncbi:MAG: hypothetical protein Q4G68_11850 [Planctomycetia bacterium]|nr:hypothetical protein [Planctomycetia bacterium]
MKKFMLIALVLLAASTLTLGCRSAGGCWTRNGSRVPVQSSYPAATNVYPAEQIVYASPANSCNACEPCAANACDPCGTGTAAAGYPSTATPMPGSGF